MSARIYTNVPEWLVQQQHKTLTELEGQTISRGEATRRLQLAAWLARSFICKDYTKERL